MRKHCNAAETKSLHLEMKSSFLEKELEKVKFFPPFFPNHKKNYILITQRDGRMNSLEKQVKALQKILTPWENEESSNSDDENSTSNSDSDYLEEEDMEDGED